MRRLAAASLALSSLAGCATNSGYDLPVPLVPGGKADGQQQPACSLDWWHWLLKDYIPMLDKPASEVSADQLAAIAAQAPDMGQTSYTYSACWQPWFSKYVFVPSATQLSNAAKKFITQGTADYLSYTNYQANLAMPAELARNAAALAAIMPSTATATDVSTYDTTYGTVYWPAIAPVGVPGLMAYDNVVENEWVVDAAESPYLSLIEAGRVDPTVDGGYQQWMTDFNSWIFGPNPTGGGLSFVFKAPFIGGTNADYYGLQGVQLDTNGNVFVPDPVRAYITRIEATRPMPIGPTDSSGWMSQYHARMLRAQGNRDQPISIQANDLMLSILEEVKPAQLIGLDSYNDWLDLEKICTSYLDRLATMEPCVAAADMSAAMDAFTASGLPTTAAPVACN